MRGLAVSDGRFTPEHCEPCRGIVLLGRGMRILRPSVQAEFLFDASRKKRDYGPDASDSANYPCSPSAEFIDLLPEFCDFCAKDRYLVLQRHARLSG